MRRHLLCPIVLACLGCTACAPAPVAVTPTSTVFAGGPSASGPMSTGSGSAATDEPSLSASAGGATVVPTGAPSSGGSASGGGASPSSASDVPALPDAQEVVRSWLSQREILFRTGQAPASMGGLVTGAAADLQARLIAETKTSGRRLVGGQVRTVYLRPTPRPAGSHSDVELESCQDLSTTQIVADGQSLGSPGSVRELFTVARTGGSLRITTIGNQKVQSC